MEQYFDALKKYLLFRGTTDAELSAMLPCLGARTTRFDRGDFIMTEGEAACDVLPSISISVIAAEPAQAMLIDCLMTLEHYRLKKSLKDV